MIGPPLMDSVEVKNQGNNLTLHGMVLLVEKEDHLLEKMLLVMKKLVQ